MKFLRERILPGLRAVGHAGLEVTFPRWCVACGGLVEGGTLEHLCERCVQGVSFAAPPNCATCGWPFYGAVEGARRCPHCIELEPRFSQGRTGLLVKGVARLFVHELKYHQGLHLRGDVRALARRAPWLVEFVRGAVLVPVPLHPRRRWWRGFNQALVVAEALAAEAGETRVMELLARVRNTPTQTRLDRAQREKNVKGAFAVVTGATVSAEARYVLVDDVFTTGATLNACAETLRKAGAKKVDVATLGHG